VEVNTADRPLANGVSSHPLPDTITIHLPGLDAPLEFRDQDEITLGRGDGVSLCLSNFDPLVGEDVPLVSRRHAVIRRSEWGFTIEDLSSTNGTWVNGMELKPGQIYLLRNGDQLKLAEQYMFVYLSSSNGDDPMV
jgi:pSer/pThr/pTyr-binding forkhead associated (FHA) protein